MVHYLIRIVNQHNHYYQWFLTMAINPPLFLTCFVLTIIYELIAPGLQSHPLWIHHVSGGQEGNVLYVQFLLGASLFAELQAAIPRWRIRASRSMVRALRHRRIQ